MTHNEEGIKEVKKEGFSSTTVRLPTLFIGSSSLCLPLKALLFFISFNLCVISILDFSFKVIQFEMRNITALNNRHPHHNKNLLRMMILMNSTIKLIRLPLRPHLIGS